MFKSLELLSQSEARARRYLIEKSWKEKKRFCIRCGSRKIYRLADKRYRCARCGYTFQEFAGRWIAELKISAAQWLWTLKLFELEVTPDRIADEVGISYPTVLKAIRLIRSALLQQYLSAKPRNNAEAVWQAVLTESLRRAPVSGRSRGNGLIFSVGERNGTIDIAPAHNLSRAALRKSNLAMTRVGQVSYVMQHEQSQALILWGGRQTISARPLGSARARGRAGAVEAFLMFVGSRLAGSRISEQQFPLHLIEMKFRYEHRKRRLFDLLAGAIAQLVPSR
jgi:transposase